MDASGDVVMETGGRKGGGGPLAADREKHRQRRADGQGDSSERIDSKTKPKFGKQKKEKFPKGRNPHAAPFRATGFIPSEDPISLEELEARKRRAERFGLLNELQPALKKLKLINKPFPGRLMFEGRRDADPNLPRRLDTVHMYGVDLMNSKDVLRYFSDYEPKYVEWINDSSCNIVFSNGGDAMRAIMGMGAPVRMDGVPTEGADAAEESAGEKKQSDPSVGMYEWHRGPPFIKSKEGPAIHLMFRMATIEDRREANAPKQTRKLWRLPMSMATRIQKWDATEGGRSEPTMTDEQQKKGGGDAQAKKNLKKRQRRKAQKEAKLKAKSQTEGNGEAEGRVDDLRNLISRLRLTPPAENENAGANGNGTFTEGAVGEAPATPVNTN